jgi:hypothetical protein
MNVLKKMVRFLQYYKFLLIKILIKIEIVTILSIYLINLYHINKNIQYVQIN